MSWRESAACRGANADLFFPERGASTRPAKAICAACSVQAECLEYALASGERHGIFGGKAPRERRKMRRDRIDTAQVFG
jgi:WhiB family redox-sensing transcriptional regulator